MRIPSLPLLLVVSALAGACSSTSTPVAQPGASPSDTPTPTVIAASWDGPAEPVALPNGWTVDACEGDAPLLCVRDGDRHVGRLELLTFGGGSDGTSLEDRVADFLATMTADRLEGCGTAYEVEPLPVTSAVLAGLDAVSYGFDGRGPAGVEEERVRGWMAVDNDTVVVVTANAHSEDGCLGNEGEFTPADLAAIEESLGALVAATPLPGGTVAEVHLP